MFIYHTTQANAGHMIDSALRKKKWSQNSSNFVLGNCATLEVWAIFSLLIMFGTKTIIAKNKLISWEVKHCNCITVIDQLLYQSHTETSSLNIQSCDIRHWRNLVFHGKMLLILLYGCWYYTTSILYWFLRHFPSYHILGVRNSSKINS